MNGTLLKHHVGSHGDAMLVVALVDGIAEAWISAAMEDLAYLCSCVINNGISERAFTQKRPRGPKCA